MKILKSINKILRDLKHKFKKDYDIPKVYLKDYKKLVKLIERKSKKNVDVFTIENTAFNRNLLHHYQEYKISYWFQLDHNKLVIWLYDTNKKVETKKETCWKQTITNNKVTWYRVN